MEETVTELKTFEILNDIYEKAKVQLKDLNNDGDKPNKSYFEPVILYINEMLQEKKEEKINYTKLLAMKSSLLFEQAKILISKNDVALALEVLKESLEMLKDLKTNPHVMYLYFRVLNHYSYFLAKNNYCDIAKKYLEDGDDFYKNLQTKNAILVYNTDDLFQDNYLLKGNNILKFEKLITNNYQMLAWVSNKLNLIDNFLIYHHIVLKRQLETQDGHAFTWIFRCAKMASYFCGLNKFKEARHHLLAAYSVLQEYEVDLLKYRKAPHFPADWDNLQHYYADLGKHWVKYALFLYEASRRKSNSNIKSNEQLLDNLLSTSLSCINISSPKDEKVEEKSNEKTTTETTDMSAENKDGPISNSDVNLENSSPTKEEEKVSTESEPKVKISALESYDFNFPSLNLQQKEMNILASPIKTTEEARSLFLYIQEWIRRAKSYYNIRDYTLENINLILDLNELYKHLVNYEYDLDSQYTIQKRRSDILETLITTLKELKPQCYLAVSIELLRELTEVQIDLVTLNLKKLCSIQLTSTPNVSSCYQENVRKLESLSVIYDQLGHSSTSL